MRNIHSDKKQCKQTYQLVKREGRLKTSRNISLRPGCFLVRLFCSRNFFSLLTINCVLKSGETSAYEFASAEEARIFERQSVLEGLCRQTKQPKCFRKRANFRAVYLWRHMLHVCAIAFSAFLSHLSSWFIFVLQIRKWFY